MQEIINQDQLTQTSTFEEEAPLDNFSDSFVLGLELARDRSPLEGAACEPEYIKLPDWIYYAGMVNISVL